MTTGSAGAASGYWRHNLWVCAGGSFTTLVAMTLLLPFLPIYIEELGLTGHAAIVQWSGIAYGATFFTAALSAPLWGRLGDLYGRKLMLIRASLGMAIAMSLMGMAQDVTQLVLLRLLTGVLGGYASGSMVLVAAQTPKAHTGQALGILSSAIMAGNLVGPLIGGTLPALIGIRATFLIAGGVIFLAFLATTFLLREDRRPAAAKAARKQGAWAALPDRRPVVAMLVTATVLMFATMSIEPIITAYVATLVQAAKVTFVSGLTMSAGALGAALSGPRLGRLADRIGHRRVLVICLALAAALLVPQAMVTQGWQLIGLRLAMGLVLGGLMPCITAIIRHNTPEAYTGTILGYSISAQYVGQVAGPLTGGFVGGHVGMPAVFWATAVILALTAVAVARLRQG